MIRVNLLPHREEKRRARRQQFYALSGLVAVLAAFIIFLVFSLVANRINAQEERNSFLKREIGNLDKEIDEIKRLREQSNALLARKRVIETLQSNRAEAVGIFNDLAKLTPEGIYLKSFKQTNDFLTLYGYAQSNARVSGLMHNLESSILLENPVLLEIKATTVEKRRLNDFSLTIHVKRAITEDKKGAKPAAKPAAAQGAKS